MSYVTLWGKSVTLLCYMLHYREIICNTITNLFDDHFSLEDKKEMFGFFILNNTDLKKMKNENNIKSK